jgi:hypothetical protein
MGMPRPWFPKTLHEFQLMFATESLGSRPSFSHCEICCSRLFPIAQIAVATEKNQDKGSASINHVAIFENRNYTLGI